MFINNDCKLQKIVSNFTSLLFLKTVTLEIGRQKGNFGPSESSVKNFLKQVFEREKNLGNPTPYIDNDIWKWFTGKVMPAFTKFSSTIYRFTKSLTHAQILEEAEKTGVKKIFTYLEAFSIVREAVLACEVDEKGKGILVYFQLPDSTQLYRFRAYRGDDGRLCLSVNGVNPDADWDGGYGAAFSN
jgi:hypothetical protein